MFKIETKNNIYLPFDKSDEQKWEGAFYFLQGADTQFGMEDSIRKRENPGCLPEIGWSTQLVEDAHKMRPRPRFLVICGDLLDAFPDSHKEERQGQEKYFKDIFYKLEIPLVCVCGNHDVSDQPTYETVDSYRSSFGDDFFSFWCGGVFFIVLNSQYYENSSQVPKLFEEQEEWLDRQLESRKSLDPKHIVVFQHIPYFLKTPDEGKDYFNIEINLRLKLLERLYSAGVRYIFAGHYHRNAGGMYKDMELVITSAVGTQLGDDDNGFRLVKVFDDRIEHKYYNLGKAPELVSLE